MSDSYIVMNYCVLNVMFNWLDMSFGAKISERFKMEQLFNKPVRILLPENTLTSLNPKNSEGNQGGQDVYRAYKAIFHIFNATETFVTQLESGVPDEHGNYSGMVGMIQRNEADAACFIVRPDALPYEPVKIGPVYGYDEMVLMAARQPAKLKKLDISRLFLNLDQLTYSYVVICTYLVILVSMEISNYFPKRKVSKRRVNNLNNMFKHVYNYCWSILELLVDQENYKPIVLSNRLVWLSYCIASFILVFGFFTNLMSTELVAFIKPPELHSLEDLFTPYFRPMNAVILTNLPSYGLIKQSKPHSSLGLLHDRLKRDEKSSVNINFDDLQGLLTLTFSALEGIQSGQLCMVATDYVVTLLRLGACSISPGVWRSMYQSSTFRQGVLTSFYNKKLTPHILRFLEYRGRTLHEMAYIGQLGHIAMQAFIAEKSPQPFNWKSFKCFHGMTDVVDSIEQAANIKLILNAARNLFIYGSCAFVFAMLVLIVECLMHRSKKCIVKKVKRKHIARDFAPKSGQKC